MRRVRVYVKKTEGEKRYSGVTKDNVRMRDTG